MWISEEGRPFYTEPEIAQYKVRTRQPDMKVTSITVAAYGARLAEKEKAMSNDPRVSVYAKKKIMDALCEVRGYGQLRAEKACWFTKNASVAECEKWLEEHKQDPDINQPLRLPPEHGATPDDPTGAEGGAPATDADGDVTMANPEDETTDDLTENPESVTKDLNQEFLNDLISMGFAKIRAEKALYYVQSAGVAPAIDWLEKHGDDANIDKPINPKAVVQAPAKPKLTPEEAAAKAKELQERIRKEKAEREKQEAKDKEKARVESVKMAQEAQTALEESNRKRSIELAKREEEAHLKHQAELKEKLRLDYIERFGCEPPAEAEPVVKEKSTKDKITYYINSMKKQYMTTEPAKLKDCFKVLKAYLGNIVKDSTDKKFHKIKKDNNAFKNKVQPVEGAVELLDACGFQDTGECLEITAPVGDGFNCGIAVKFIDLVLGKL
jgi:hypothetical protein